MMIMKLKKFIIVLVLLSGWFCKIPFANANNDLLSRPLAELLEINITGVTLTDSNYKTVPGSVTVFTQDIIRRMGIDTIEELMNFSPGFQSYRQAESGIQSSYSSRGRRIGTSGREVLVLVDGMRTDGIWTSGTGFTIPMLSLANVERVEFIRGPGSAIYGSNSYLGTINIITIKDENEFQIKAGENNLVDAFTNLSTKKNDFEASIFAQHFGNDGEEYSVDDVFSTGTVQTKDKQEGNQLNIHARKHNTTFDLMAAQRRADGFFVLESLDDRVNYLEQHYAVFEIGHEFFINKNFTSKLRAGYRTSSSEIRARASAANVYYSDIEDKEINIDWHNDWQLDTGNSLQFGLSYRRQQLQHAYVVINNSPPEIPVSSYFDPIDISGVYAQYQYALTEQTNLLAGLRYDDYDNVGSNTSPRIAIVHQLTDTQTLKFLYGEAFRSPASNELYAINNPALIANPNLAPETVETYELDWLKQWRNSALTLGYFENTFKNSIIQDASSFPRIFVNGPDEHSKGYELEFNTELSDVLQLRATYTYFSEKPPSSFRDSDTISSVILDYHPGKWNLNVSAYYQSEKNNLIDTSGNQITLPSYWVVYGKLVYEYKPDIKTFIQIKNLLDENYQTPSQGSIIPDGVPNRGREISLGLNIMI